MKSYFQPVRFFSVIIFSVLTNVLLVTPGMASIGTITKPDLAGAWQITLNGVTGCGNVTMLVNATLNNLGASTNATVVTHGACGDSTLTAQTFTITSLAANGSGTANLSCGSGCGWSFKIQVSPDRSIFNIIDVDPANPGNYLNGVAIHQ